MGAEGRGLRVRVLPIHVGSQSGFEAVSLCF